KKDAEELSCGFEVYLEWDKITTLLVELETSVSYLSLRGIFLVRNSLFLRKIKYNYYYVAFSSSYQ
ncbi:hypothetical protein, partial [Phocaeicola plebeius]|uniref:hypothetical protein n=1 Tax=Phocaeicola plebeius TaxID=310297 RepID=UPI0022E20CE1